MPENEKYENTRTSFLGHKGYKIIRFYNSDINKSINWFYLYNLDICEDYLLKFNKDDIINNFKDKEIIEYKENGLENIKYLHELAREKKLEEFYGSAKETLWKFILEMVEKVLFISKVDPKH